MKTRSKGSTHLSNTIDWIFDMSYIEGGEENYWNNRNKYVERKEMIRKIYEIKKIWRECIFY